LSSFLFFFSSLSPPLSSTLFPFTTLFRSVIDLLPSFLLKPVLVAASSPRSLCLFSLSFACNNFHRLTCSPAPTLLICRSTGRPRSEEHTSELQSRSDLVCRLLLEKKNKIR